MTLKKLADLRLGLTQETFLVFAAAFAAFFLMIGDKPGVPEYDTLYHFKLAELILREGPWVDVTWLPFTVLGKAGPDHHWLWHVVLAPFALIEDKSLGIRLASAFTGALIPAGFSWTARRMGMPLAPLFALVAVFSAICFPERFLRLRTQDLALILMFLAVYALSARKAALLLAISFVFMQSYHGAVVLLPITAIFAGLCFVQKREVPIRPALAVVAGLLLGLMLSPWFPANIDYLLFHTLFKVSSQDALLIGNEWYRPGSMWLLMEAWPAHVALLLALAAYLWRRRGMGGSGPIGVDTGAMVLVTALFCYLYTRHARFVEYYAPFAVLCAGLLLRDAGVDQAGRAWRKILAPLVVIFLLIGIYRGAWIFLRGMEWPSPDRYRDMVAHVEKHSQTGDMVFNASWGDFVLLFWHSGKLRYVNGLDGNYLVYGDPERFRLWDQVVHGSVAEGDVARSVRDAFNTHWMIIPRSPFMVPLVNKLNTEDRAELRMENADGWLFYLHDER